MIKFDTLRSDSRLAFQAGLISRAIGLFVFTIIIAHRWSMKEIALFESFSIFQYVLFFTWFPAWGLVTLRLGTGVDVTSQKSFLFSNLLFSIGVMIALFSVMMLGQFSFSIWPGQSIGGFVGILLFMIIYLVSQSEVFMLHVEGKILQQWIYAVLYVLVWILIALISTNFQQFLSLFLCTAGLIALAQLFSRSSSVIAFHSLFWKDVCTYSLYLSIGAATVVVAGYYVLHRYGLEAELNYFRYGSRELPIVPAVLAAYGQSFLASSSRQAPGADLKKTLPGYLIVFSPIAGIILLSRPLVHLLYGSAFLPAATLMSTFLLIYVPRMIQSNIILQAKDDRSSLIWIALVEFIGIVAALVLIAPRYGLVAVIWILVGGTALEKLVQMMVLTYKHGIPVKSYLPIRPFILWMVGLISAYCLHFYIT